MIKLRSGGRSVMLLVLDTSIVLKWFAEEEGFEDALELKQGLVEGEYGDFEELT